MDSVFKSFDIPRQYARMLGECIDSASETSLSQGFIGADRFLKIEEPISTFYSRLYIYFEEFLDDVAIDIRNSSKLKNLTRARKIKSTFFERIENEIDQLNYDLNYILCIPFGEDGWQEIAKGVIKL